MSEPQKTSQQDQTHEALTTINRELEEKAAQERARELKLPYLDVGVFPVNPDILHILPLEEAQRGLLMPYFRRGQTLRVALAHPTKPETLEIIKKLESGGYTVDITFASETSIKQAYRFYASDQYKLKVEVKNVVKAEEIHYEKELENLAQIKEKIATLPAEEALNMLNVSAIKAGASDIHMQPEENFCSIRFRIDGILHKVFDINKDVYANLANQLKYKAKMKLNITTVPQDGRFRFIVNEINIDVRVSSLPTEYGEAFVCRILNTAKHFGSFEELGFSGRSLQTLNKAKNLAQGMVLVTGPTSSGKTTSLYVLLNFYNKPDLNIVTLEDPIEYHLPGITQSQVNEKRGYTFADGLRSILRQDPDVVMIGEIRDIDTANAAMQAALTGHVLLSTLHTNGAVEAIPRLINIGLQPFMVAPALSVVVAQRLVRRLCPSCKYDAGLTQNEKAFIEKILVEVKAIDTSVGAPVPDKLKKNKGCEQCNFTGFRGQLTISEVLLVDDEVKEAILNKKSTPELLALAQKKGMLTMLQDAILKVLEGHTTLDEVHRVINA